MHGAGELILPFLNFIALIGILVYFLRKPLSDFVQTRHVTVRDELAQVRTLLGDAQRKHSEFTSRLAQLQGEVVQIHQQMKSDAEEARTRILNDARKLGDSVVADARSTSTALYNDLKSRLYSELSTQVLDRAEKILRERLTGDDRVRIRQEFSRQVEAAQ